MLDHLHALIIGHVFQHIAAVLHGEEISFSQWNALYQLFHDGPQTIAEIARGANLTHNAASRMVDRLVQGGLVERYEAQSDRRQKRVELTDAGVGHLRDMQEFTARAYAELLSQVPAPVLHPLLEALEGISPHLPIHPMLDFPAPENQQSAGKTIPRKTS